MTESALLFCFSTIISIPSLPSPHFFLSRRLRSRNIAAIMRPQYLALSAVFSVTLAQQVPLFDRARGYFAQASSLAQSAINSAQTAIASGATAADSPIDITASKIAASSIPELKWSNWRNILSHSGKTRPSHERELWMVLMTGGNKTCHGKCTQVDKAWNVRLTPVYYSSPPLNNAIANTNIDILGICSSTPCNT